METVAVHPSVIKVQAAVMQSLNASLLAARSATFTIEKWCADHAMSPDPRIRARLLREIDSPRLPNSAGAFRSARMRR